MTIAIHQPNFIPWLGYFYKIKHCDCFVLLDDVQYSKNSLINRNKIRCKAGEQWVTMPVLHSGCFGQRINETHMSLFEKHYNKFIHAIQMNYSRAPFFDEILPLLAVDDFSCDLLSDFNERLIRRFIDYLEIKTPIRKASDLVSIEGCSTDRLVSICKILGANKYLAGFGGKNYQDDVLFYQAGVEPIVSSFSYPHYTQLYEPFLPNMSVVDVLMNTGKRAIQFI